MHKENIYNKIYNLVTMKVECCIYHGRLTLLPRNAEVRLEDLEKYSTKFYSHRPRMIKYRKHGITILIFTSFKFRVMGKGDHHARILEEFLHSLPWKSTISEMTRNMTVSHHLPNTNINLHKLDRDHFQVEMELFPAAKLIHAGSEHVNVFHSGNIVMTGVCELSRADHLIELVLSHIPSAKY